MIKFQKQNHFEEISMLSKQLSPK